MQKLKNECLSSKKMMESVIHPLDVLDDLIDGMTDLLKIGIEEKHPDLSEKEMMYKLHELILLNKNFNSKKIQG